MGQGGASALPSKGGPQGRGCLFSLIRSRKRPRFFFYITLPYRCEVSPCYKPEKSSLPPQRSFGQSAEAGTDLCSLLCLPIMTFSGALP